MNPPRFAILALQTRIDLICIDQPNIFTESGVLPSLDVHSKHQIILPSLDVHSKHQIILPSLDVHSKHQIIFVK